MTPGRVVARGTDLLDLVEQFAALLADSAPGDPQADRMLRAVAEADLVDPVAAHVTFVGLVSALNDLSPDGAFFGPHPQQPTAFGWWPIAEAVTMHPNAIRKQLGQLEPERLAAMDPFREKARERKSKQDVAAHRPIYAPTVEEKLSEAAESLDAINELQESGALFVHNNTRYWAYPRSRSSRFTRT